jgi:hypothetical protein
MRNYIIGFVVILFIGTTSYYEVQKKYYEVQKKQEIKQAIEKTREEEQLLCEKAINEANSKSSNKTIKTIIKYEKVKSNVSTLNANQRIEFVQQLQIEDFNFAD